MHSFVPEREKELWIPELCLFTVIWPVIHVNALHLTAVSLRGLFCVHPPNFQSTIVSSLSKVHRVLCCPFPFVVWLLWRSSSSSAAVFCSVASLFFVISDLLSYLLLQPVRVPCHLPLSLTVYRSAPIYHASCLFLPSVSIHLLWVKSVTYSQVPPRVQAGKTIASYCANYARGKKLINCPKTPNRQAFNLWYTHSRLHRSGVWLLKIVCKLTALSISCGLRLSCTNAS